MLTRLGLMICEMCEEKHECFDVGSAGSPEARCARCYADGIGHGAQFETFQAAADAAVDALGEEYGDEVRDAIAPYYHVTADGKTTKRN